MEKKIIDIDLYQRFKTTGTIDERVDKKIS
jgi:hypothetical protein